MEYSAAKVVVQDKTFVNFSFSHREIEPESGETSESESRGFFPCLWGAFRENTKEQIPPTHRHYVVVLDVGRKIGDDFLDTVKETVISFQEMLYAEDLFSLVTCENPPRLLLHHCTSSDSGKLSKAVESIEATSGNDVCGGLSQGFTAMATREAKEVHNVLVVISDGCSNVETTRQDDLVEIVRNEADRNVAVIYSLGIGHSYANDFFNRITSNSAGIHYHLDTYEDIPYEMGNIIGDVQPLLFKDVQLTISVPPSCIQEVQYPHHLGCRQVSEGIEIQLAKLRVKDNHGINICLKDAEISNVPTCFQVKLKANSIWQDLHIEEESTVNLVLSKDENQAHDVYRSNFARILFASETKQIPSNLMVEKLTSLKSMLSLLPRHSKNLLAEKSENPIISSLLHDVEDLKQSVEKDDPAFQYRMQCVQTMHSKARGWPYESDSQQTVSITMRDQVASRRNILASLKLTSQNNVKGNCSRQQPTAEEIQYMYPVRLNVGGIVLPAGIDIEGNGPAPTVNEMTRALLAGRTGIPDSVTTAARQCTHQQEMNRIPPHMDIEGSKTAD